MRIPLGTSDFVRSIAETPAIHLINRYFESDPTNQDDQIALLCRPSLKLWLEVGTGPIRGIYSQPGAFEEALFVVSGFNVYSIAQDESVTLIGSLATGTSAVSMTATDTYLFIADGTALYYYTTNDYSTGTLTASGAISAGEQVVIGTTYYQFAADVTTGTPDGTASFPWLVALGTGTEQALENLAAAIGATGEPGVDYNSGIVPNPDAAAVSSDATTLVIRALYPGVDGDSVVTTETGVNLAWGAGVLAGGGGSNFAEVVVPDGDGIIAVGAIASYTICVVAQGYEKNGRFYWIEPGEIIIDPLNFATAERSPDPANDVKVVGDQFWLPGPSTNEVWYLAGDPLAPFYRQQGRLFDKGVWGGSVIQIKDDVMAVGVDGTVYRIGATPVVVSTPGIAQRIREAINTARSS